MLIVARENSTVIAGKMSFLTEGMWNFRGRIHTAIPNSTAYAPSWIENEHPI